MTTTYDEVAVPQGELDRVIEDLEKLAAFARHEAEAADDPWDALKAIGNDVQNLATYMDEWK